MRCLSDRRDGSWWPSSLKVAASASKMLICWSFHEPVRLGLSLARIVVPPAALRNQVS
jgi:DUF971 family protein